MIFFINGNLLRKLKNFVVILFLVKEITKNFQQNKPKIPCKNTIKIKNFLNFCVGV